MGSVCISQFLIIAYLFTLILYFFGSIPRPTSYGFI